MWAMYTDRFSGVRISFPEELFGSVKDVSFGLHIRDISENPLNQKQPFLAGPEDIEYRDTMDQIDHEIITSDKNRHPNGSEYGMKFDPWVVGKYKLNDWKFEEETRFFVPAIDHFFIAGSKSFNDKIGEIDSILANLPKEIYITYNKKIVPEIEFLLGPKTDEADMLIVEALIDKLTNGVKCIEKSNKKIN